MQNRIDRYDGDYDPIILGFGMCSKATVGLRARRSRLVVARTDDCIGIFLGSRQAYRSELGKEPGTYFLTRGWVGANKGTPFNEYDRAVRRWGESKASRLLRSMLKHYRRVLYVKSPAEPGDSPTVNEARDTADRFELEFRQIDGKATLIKELIEGPWEDQCLLIEPGDTLNIHHFLGRVNNH